MSMLMGVAAAGLLMGIFFNVYALTAVCLIFSLASFIFILFAGSAPTAGHLISDLCCLQGGYLAGLWLSVVAFRAKPSRATTSKS